MQSRFLYNCGFSPRQSCTRPALYQRDFRPLFGVNPMAGVVEGFRWGLLGHGSAPWALMAVSGTVALGLLIGGLYYFRRMEHSFADVI